MMTLEKQEFNRRLKAMVLNVMRGAFYLKITRPRLERFCNRTESKPIISMAAGKGKCHLPRRCVTNSCVQRCPSRLLASLGADLLLHFSFIIVASLIKKQLIFQLEWIPENIFGLPINRWVSPGSLSWCDIGIIFFPAINLVSLFSLFFFNISPPCCSVQGRNSLHLYWLVAFCYIGCLAALQYHQCSGTQTNATCQTHQTTLQQYKMPSTRTST